jgi:hypothetical protein
MKGVPIEPGRPTVTMRVPGTIEAVRKVYPWHVRCQSTPQEPDLGARAIAWAREMFGPPAHIHVPKKLIETVEVLSFKGNRRSMTRGIPYEYPLDHRWDVHHPEFYFRDKADAAAFTIIWGGRHA